MPKREYDPLTHLPKPDVIRQHLHQTERLARRLRILLQVSEAVNRTEDANSSNLERAEGEVILA